MWTIVHGLLFEAKQSGESEGKIYSIVSPFRWHKTESTNGSNLFRIERARLTPCAQIGTRRRTNVSHFVSTLFLPLDHRCHFIDDFSVVNQFNYSPSRTNRKIRANTENGKRKTESGNGNGNGNIEETFWSFWRFTKRKRCNGNGETNKQTNGTAAGQRERKIEQEGLEEK